jgi:hypothetical protein
MRQRGLPLPPDDVEVIEADLAWEDIVVSRRWDDELAALCVRRTCSAVGLTPRAALSPAVAALTTTHCTHHARTTQWANMFMTVRGTQYKMLRLQFMPRGKPGEGRSPS